MFLSYATVGTLGYIAFSGKDFDTPSHQSQTYNGVIDLQDNFLNMFTYDAIPAVLVRSLIFGQLMCAYPLVNHFQRTLLLNLLFKGCDSLDDLSPTTYKLLNIGISVVPLTMAIFYPKIGTILGYAGAASGFFMIYLVPVVAYMKMRKIEILHPELAAALQENEVQVVIPKGKSFPMSPQQTS